MTARAEPPVVVMGLGSPLRRDDGLGLAALRRLTERGRLPASVRVVEGGTLGVGLLDLTGGGERLLVLDAVVAGGPPGRLVRLAGEAAVKRRGGPVSAHDLALPDALALARRLGRGPSELVVLGLEPESVQPGAGLSDAVEAELDELVDAAVAQLRRWGAL
jgi:hydrogenase maturation protease